MAEKDTVGETFYGPVKISGTIGSVLFWTGIPLSIMVFFIDAPWVAALVGTAVAGLLGEGLWVVFLILSVGLFAQGLAHKTYFLPRAEDARRTNMLSNSFSMPLSADKSIGYYNNDRLDPAQRLAANCMESAFFTKELARRMLRVTRTVTVFYVVIYLALLLTRRVDLGLIELAAGIIFSEEVIARWLRLEFLRRRCEDVFERFRETFAWKPDEWNSLQHAQIIRQFAFYETTKAIAAISISQRLFTSLNPRLSQQWSEIRVICGI